MKILSTISFILLSNLIFSQGVIYHQVRDARLKSGPTPVSHGLFTANNSAARSSSELGKHLSAFKLLKLNSVELKTLYNSKPKDMDMSLPDMQGQVNVQLVRSNIFAEGGKIATDLGQLISYNPPVIYYGVVQDEPNSLVWLTLYEDQVVSLVSRPGQANVILVKDGYTAKDKYIVYEDNQVKELPEFLCETQDRPLTGKDLEDFHKITQGKILLTRAVTCITMDVEFTYETYSSTYSSNETNLLNYFTGVFAGVHAIYQNEGINFVIGNTYINTTNDNYSTSSGTALDQFRSRVSTNPTKYSGSIAHLVRIFPCSPSGCSAGGVAYVDALCEAGGFKTAYSAMWSNNSNAAYPAYSWSVNVIAHESGHVFGSPHTHACAWNGNNTAIDGCGPNAGYSENCSGPIPSKGTVMSYCHLPGNPGIDFSLGFGSQPGNVIRAGATGANCANNCAPAEPTCTDGIQNGDEQGIDCGGSNCVACNPNCLSPTQFSGVTASQSTTWGGISASGATDNNLSTTNHTTAELNPWLQLDLGSSKLVTRITITNRSGCSSCVTEKRLEKFRVYVSNSSTSPTNEVYYHQTVVADGATVNITGLNATGRYIRIKAEYTAANYLHVAEVKAYGCTVDVCSGNVAPTVSVTTATTNFPVGTSLTVNANASDANNLINRVEFYNGSTLLGSDASSPYSIVLTPTSPTSYSITAKAIDECNASTTSSAVSYNATASCSDGVKNGNETGIDCGGSCTACVSLCAVSSQFTSGLTASQSTTWSGISASGAIDNNLTTTNHTNAELTPWLQIDLGSAKNITAVDVVNRSNCPSCVTSRRLEKFKVYVSNSSVPSSGDQVYSHTTLVADGATVGITGLNATGRYIRIWAEYTTANYLHLAEVKIYGCDVNNCAGNTSPNVNITTPSTSFIAGTSLAVSANATDNGNIAMVEFYHGGTMIGFDATSPYSITLTSNTATSFNITAKAIDNCNAATTSGMVTYMVTQSCTDGVMNGNETGIDCGGSCSACTSLCAVSAQFTSGLTASQSTTWSGNPASGAIDNNLSTTNHTNAELNPWLQIDLGTSKAITAIDIVNRGNCPSCVTSKRLEKFKVYISGSTTPSSNDQVYSHTTLVGDGATVSITGLSATGRYVRVWAEYTTANYLHLAEVKVYGCDFNSCAGNTAPNVSISTPSSSFIAGSGFTVGASVSDNGTVSQVEFYNGNSLLGTDNSSPYSITLSSLQAASYTITAKAIDNCGASSTSSPVLFTSSQSCNDQVKNGNETGVDCGGSCQTCTSSCTTSSQFTSGLSAAQSTSWPGTSATGAIDNNLSTTNHTNAELLPWLQINLGSVKNVTRVDVVNRGGCASCVTQRRLEKFKVYVSNSSTPTSGDLVYTHTALVGDGATISITGLNATGQYVRVWAEYTTANYLHLAEVKVYGCNTGANVAANENDNHLSDSQTLAVEVFPNPTSGELNIRYKTNPPSEATEYRLYDLMGRVLRQGWLTNDKLNLQREDNGYYLLELRNGTRRFTQKIIKI